MRRTGGRHGPEWWTASTGIDGRHGPDYASGKFAPLTSAFPQSYDEARKNIAWQRLMSLFSGIDLLEPFERIQVAIDVLAEQDQRFR